MDPDSSAAGVFTLNGNLTAKVFAHEIGHLMGAHHHYANCDEGIASDADEFATPCSLMFNDVGLSFARLQRVNQLAVRGHAEALRELARRSVYAALY